MKSRFARIVVFSGFLSFFIVASDYPNETNAQQISDFDRFTLPINYCGIEDPDIKDEISDDIYDLVRELPEPIERAFINDGVTINVVSSNIYKRDYALDFPTVGQYDNNRNIIINGDCEYYIETLAHEIGHYVQDEFVNEDSVKYNYKRSRVKMQQTIREYTGTNADECFADGFMLYILNPDYLKDYCYSYYSFIDSSIEQIHGSPSIATQGNRGLPLYREEVSL